MNTTYEVNCQTDKDHKATPRDVVEQIYKLLDIKRYSNIWLPFDHNDSYFKIVADELGLSYKATHIYDDAGSDFFTTTPPSNCELMISNPPFSLQYEIVKRSFELVDSGAVKAFAWLLPLATLETNKRASLYQTRQDALSILIHKKRIKFLGESSSFDRGCCWVCYNIKGLPPLSWI